MASFYHTMFSFSELRTYDGWTTLFAWKCPFQKGISFQDWWVFIVAYWTAVAPLRSAFVDACPTGTLDRKHGQEFVAAALQDRCHSQPSGIWHMQWRVQAFLFGFVSSDRSKFVHIKLFQTARVFICHRYMTVQIKVYIYIERVATGNPRVRHGFGKPSFFWKAEVSKKRYGYPRVLHGLPRVIYGFKFGTLLFGSRGIHFASNPFGKT